MKRIILAAILSWISTPAAGRQAPPDTLKIRQVKSAAIQVDGMPLEKAWQPGSRISLTPPWTRNNAGIAHYTAVTDGNYLYFLFEVADNSINLYTSDNENDVARGDRVELFFSGEKTLDRYYCLEISPAGAILDYRARYYRVFDNAWQLKELQVAGHITGRGYVVEGRIPLESLWTMTGGKTSTLYAGVFCADYYGTEEKEVVWHSWVDPHVPKPDFHIPAAFGVFLLEQ